MVTNFERHTQELTDDEMEIIPALVNGFRNHQKENPIKAPEIVKAINEWPGKRNRNKFSEPKLRRCCNHIRSQGMLPLIATSDGYYVSYEPTEIQKQIQSLMERARSIENCANGLKQFINRTL